ncbi:AAEL007520-PA [Aedes aegypti]|uniref:AAEL007520-PA n=1 Tax=Aedes aegypti TaxID=7159 RepID=Q171V9_AEDAE|nr:AAEL007520-PA [Aedes aegypti]
MAHFDLASDKPPTYPSEWFRNNPKQKPPMEVHLVPDNRRGNLHSTVRLQFAAGTLSPAVATAFIWYELTRDQYTLSKDWESFGVVIGARGSRINISNFAAVIEQTSNLDLVAENVLFDSKDLRRYVIAVACVLRIIGIDREEYREQVITHMNALITQAPGTEINLDQVYIHYKTWATYTQYAKCLAFADMFLAEFPAHPLAGLRMGSIVCRMRDCSALVATFYILKMFRMTIGDFALWIWTKPVASQYDQVTDGGEEMDQPRSYALYFRDLGLSDKSPYSAPSNADLHLFLHTLGVTEDSERSVRARQVGTPLKNAIIANAMVVAYVYGRYNTFQKEYSHDGEPIEEIPFEAAEEIDEHQMPDSKDPDAWLGWLQQQNGIIPPFIKRQSYMHWLNHAGSRPGTIGEMLFQDATAGMLTLQPNNEATEQ